MYIYTTYKNITRKRIKLSVFARIEMKIIFFLNFINIRSNMDNKVIIPIYISTPKYWFLSPYQYLNLNIKNSFAHILLKDLIFFFIFKYEYADNKF